MCMRDYQPIRRRITKKYFDFANGTKSWHPINRNGWWIKFSTYEDDNILLIFSSRVTSQTFIRHFTDENEAVFYINFIINLDSSVVHEM